MPRKETSWTSKTAQLWQLSCQVCHELSGHIQTVCLFMSQMWIHTSCIYINNVHILNPAEKSTTLWFCYEKQWLPQAHGKQSAPPGSEGWFHLMIALILIHVKLKTNARIIRTKAFLFARFFISQLERKPVLQLSYSLKIVKLVCVCVLLYTVTSHQSYACRELYTAVCSFYNWKACTTPPSLKKNKKNISSVNIPPHTQRWL